MKTILIQNLEPIWFIGKIFLLWLMADFITGMIHWWEDAYGNPTWRILGKYVIQPNLEHHKNPRRLIKGSYWNRVDTSVYLAFMIGFVSYFCGVLSWGMIVFLVFSSQANEVHAASHRTDKENGKILVFLQSIGLLQKRKTHGWHHKAPYDTNFCVMTEFLNPVLNKIDFWAKMEWSILKIFKIKVLRGSAIRGGI